MPNIKCSPQNHNSETQQITDDLEKWRNGDHTVHRKVGSHVHPHPRLPGCEQRTMWMTEYRGRRDVGGT